MAQIDVLETIREIAATPVEDKVTDTTALYTTLLTIAAICKGAIDLNKENAK